MVTSESAVLLLIHIFLCVFLSDLQINAHIAGVAADHGVPVFVKAHSNLSSTEGAAPFNMLPGSCRLQPFCEFHRVHICSVAIFCPVFPGRSRNKILLRAQICSTHFFSSSADGFPLRSFPSRMSAPGQLGASPCSVFPRPLPPEVAKSTISFPAKS